MNFIPKIQGIWTEKKDLTFILFRVAFFLQLSFYWISAEPQHQKKEETVLQYEVTVTLKLVQVYVTDKNGNPVTDLTQSDFELWDNGQLKKIAVFEKHIPVFPEKKVEDASVMPTKIPKIMNRKFFLLFDFFRNDPPGIARSKKGALYFIETQLLPSDEVAVLSYSPLKGLILHEYLTSDHQKVKDAIQRIKEIPKLGGEGLTFQEMTGKLPLDTTLEDLNIEEQIMRTNNFSIEMKEFAKSLRYIPGFKNIIFFSRGISKSLIYDSAANPSNTKGSIVLGYYEDMIKELASSNCPIYAVNTEGTRAYLKDQDSRGIFALKQLSHLTGGKYFYNVDNYESIFRTIQNLTNNFYVLGYSIDEKWDGKFHEIKVKVKRKGCEILAQGGYFNPKPFTEYSEFEKQLHLIDLALTEKPQFQEPLTFPLIALHCWSEKDINCILILEIPVERVKEVIRQKSEVISLIFDSQKDVIDFKRGEVNFSSRPQKNIFYYTLASLPPGNYECRIVIRNLTTGKAAIGASSVKIPELQGLVLHLFPPLLLLPEKEAYYLKAVEGKRKQTAGESFSLKNIYPYISNNFRPIIKEIAQGVSKAFVVLHCLMPNISEPQLKISANLIENLSNEEIPLLYSFLSGQKEGQTWIFFMELEMPRLKSGDYILNFFAVEAKTQSQSQVTRFLKIK